MGGQASQDAASYPDLMVLLVLAVVFVIVPLLELYVIIQVAQVVGGWQTLAVLVVESALGVWLLKRQGLGVLDRINRSLRGHQLPHRELIDGFLILLAGALMLAPGFLTDILGYLLLIPATRAMFRSLVTRRFRRRLGRGVGWFGAGPDGAASQRRRTWVESRVVDVQPNDPVVPTEHRDLPPSP